MGAVSPIVFVSSRHLTKPDGTCTTDEVEYANAWRYLGDRVLKLFPGYGIHGYDPDIWFVREEIGTISGTSKVSDQFRLSVCAINTLLTGTVPPKKYREDF